MPPRAIETKKFAADAAPAIETKEYSLGDSIINKRPSSRQRRLGFRAVAGVELGNLCGRKPFDIEAQGEYAAARSALDKLADVDAADTGDGDGRKGDSDDQRPTEAECIAAE